MKRIAGLLLATCAALYGYAQDSMEKVMEQRAREMYRVIGLDDPSAWKKFVKENYSQALIDRPMQAKREESVDGEATSSSSSSSDQTPGSNLDKKANMFGMLHRDFGSSKLVSLKPTGDSMEMVLDNGAGLTGTFRLKFDKNKPYLITGLGVQAGN